MMTITTYHTQTCLEAWINCENLLTRIAGLKTSISRKFTKVIDECALICMGTFHAIKSNTQNAININRMALLCVGICEECAELCETQNDEIFRQCARVCRQCSESISDLIIPLSP